MIINEDYDTFYMNRINEWYLHRRKSIMLDVDNTITNTTQKFCEIYNKVYADHPNFVSADWTKVRQWNFSDQCPLIKNSDECEALFDMPEMYRNIYYMPGAVEAIKKLSLKYNIEIVTIGRNQNLAHKWNALTNDIPFNNYWPVDSNIYSDKSHIDMSGKIFIDDVAENLTTSNAEVKICFGDVLPWNDKWHGLRCRTWHDVLELLY